MRLVWLVSLIGLSLSSSAFSGAEIAKGSGVDLSPHFFPPLNPVTRDSQPATSTTAQQIAEAWAMLDKRITCQRESILEHRKEFLRTIERKIEENTLAQNKQTDQALHRELGLRAIGYFSYGYDSALKNAQYEKERLHKRSGELRAWLASVGASTSVNADFSALAQLIEDSQTLWNRIVECSPADLSFRELGVRYFQKKFCSSTKATKTIRAELYHLRQRFAQLFASTSIESLVPPVPGEDFGIPGSQLEFSVRFSSPLASQLVLENLVLQTRSRHGQKQAALGPANDRLYLNSLHYFQLLSTESGHCPDWGLSPIALGASFFEIVFYDPGKKAYYSPNQESGLAFYDRLRSACPEVPHDLGDLRFPMDQLRALFSR